MSIRNASELVMLLTETACNELAKPTIKKESSPCENLPLRWGTASKRGVAEPHEETDHNACQLASRSPCLSLLLDLLEYPGETRFSEETIEALRRCEERLELVSDILNGDE